MQTHPERGIALVITLLLMSVLSVLAASLMFLSQTETYASMNYRMMSQARYAAESGIQKASNFLLDGTQYAMPGGPTDPLLPNYDRTKSPVVCVTGCPNSDPKNPNHWVILSATSSQLSNYPSAAVTPGGTAVVTAFNTAAQGSLTAGGATLTYGAYATLIAMQVFESYGGTTQVIQTWEITSNGALAGPRSATTQVVATVETPKVPANSYAAFATDNTCGALYLHGNVTINSYDSTNLAAGLNTLNSSNMQSWGGNVGTNGNLLLQGSVDVQGSLSTPRTGVGSCTAGAVDGLTYVGGAASLDGNMVQLPAAVNYPTPVFSATPNPNVTVDIGNATEMAKPAAQICADLSSTLTLGTTCLVDTVAKTVTIDGGGTDVTMPNVLVSNNYSLVLTGHAPGANNINVNSLKDTGGQIQIKANLGATDAGESVVLKVAGKNPTGVTSSLPDPTDMATPFDLDNWVINSNFKFDASTLQIAYGGTADLRMTGNSSSAATLYAPNASFEMRGTTDWYGSVLAKTFDNGGNPNIHYDRRLAHDFYVAGHPMAGTFNWKRYQ